ncbi:uncharacterized protein RAG0_04090 [Rhynchosporium agropyri]|uniref:Uncharacterized protein n=1 Tax=Rhynchosporium agropyri TaxID=914238 RepID=A0A1E1K7K2_9HELO|nr:uncharacterized protein RAG0_04090 [Rhynchosporium agropyri]
MLPPPAVLASTSERGGTNVNRSTFHLAPSAAAWIEAPQFRDKRNNFETSTSSKATYIMEPFPPFKTAADSRAELHSTISTRLGLIEAFTTSPACSDEDLEKIEHFLGIIESTVLTKVEKEVDDDRYTAPAARVSTMHPYPRIPSAYASGALLIPSTDPESPVSPKTINYIPRIFSNNYALTAGSS